jgi:N-acetylneuraminate synthase
MSAVLIIAEAGVNHNGRVELAFDLVDAAVAANVDIVKFQTFQAKNLVLPFAEQAKYQKENTQKTQSQYELLKQLELTFEEHQRVAKYCQQQGIAYLSTAFDDESLTFLQQEIGLKTLKIPSGELTNSPFVLLHAQTGCDLIVSTGMATMEEIEQALAVIAFGLVNEQNVEPSIAAFKQAYLSEEGQCKLKEKVTLLHCTTEYPAPFEQVNLNAMTVMSDNFLLPIGYSDHTQGISIPIAAAAKGATIIEKHFTLSRTMEGPDHKASIEPDELSAMVEGIRQVEQALGVEEKKPVASEIKNIAVARKSLVATCSIKKGQMFRENMLTAMRPGTGVSPHHYWQLLTQKSTKGYQAGDLIDEQYL